MRIGMHVQGFSGGVAVGPQNALARGAECLQIFVSNPRQWRLPPVSEDADREFVREMRAGGLRPLFLHAPYLVNLASPNAETQSRSIDVVLWTIVRAEALRAKGVVVHAGSSAGGNRLESLHRQTSALRLILGETSAGPRLLLELTAGGAGAVGSTFVEAAEVLDACHGHPRLGLCLDACHLHAAGYDLSDRAGVGAMAAEMRRLVGIRPVALIHANDSRDPRGSHRDRHFHVGRGAIGRAGFAAFVAERAFGRIPFVCETPGDIADDRRNLRTLKKMRDAAAR